MKEMKQPEQTGTDMLAAYLLGLATDLDNGCDPAKVAEELRRQAHNLQRDVGKCIGDTDVVRQRAIELARKYGSQHDAAHATGVSQAEIHSIIYRTRGQRQGFKPETLRKLGIRRVTAYVVLEMPDNEECERRRLTKCRELDGDNNKITIDKRLKLEEHAMRLRGKARTTES